VRTYLLRRERVGLGAIPEVNSENYRVSPTKIPFSTGTYRAISAVLTVPVGKDYRPWEEKITYRQGSYTVPVGKDYRSRREGLPFSTGRITVPVGKFVEGFSCKSRRNSRKLALRLYMLMH
jgi:hypothetical protein